MIDTRAFIATIWLLIDNSCENNGYEELKRWMSGFFIVHIVNEC